MYVVEVPIGGRTDGDVVLVQVREVEEGLVRVGRSGQRVIATASRSFDTMLDTVRPVADSLVNTFRGLAHAPDAITVDFGVSLSAEADVVVASATTEANFAVSLTWRRPAPEEGQRP